MRKPDEGSRMATVQIQVANPTNADVTVNAKVAKAGKVTRLGLDDTTNEAEQFLAGKCALVSAAAGTIEEHEQGAFILYSQTPYS